ncbi:MAG: tetratricopeptide repeat protein [Thermodesulfovibrionales bacterium]|nr:tetratricopeptide repeat protein [Thermodesulfovibrionales bacterium]
MAQSSNNSKNSPALNKIILEAERLRESSSYRQALRLFLKALKTYGKMHDEDGMLRCMLSAGDIFRMVGDFDQAAHSYSGAIALARKTRDPLITADAQAGLGLALRAQGKWRDALRYIRRSRKFYEKNKDRQGVAFSLWAEAGALRIQGDITGTLRLYREAYRRFRSLGDTQGIGYCLCGLGGASRIAGNFRDSLKFYKEANTIFTDLKDTFGKAYSFCGIGNAYRMLQDYNNALMYFSKAVRLYTRIGDRVSYSYTLWGVATAYKMTGDSEKARLFFKKALGLFRKTKDPRGVIYCTLGLGEIALLKKKNALAEKYLSFALQESRTYRFALELCYAQILCSARDGKKVPGCYNKAGTKLSFRGIPFNIP